MNNQNKKYFINWTNSLKQKLGANDICKHCAKDLKYKKDFKKYELTGKYFHSFGFIDNFQVYLCEECWTELSENWLKKFTW